MSLEIEKKAWIESAEETEKKVSSLMEFLKDDEKHDVYYFSGDKKNIDYRNDPIFRIRKNKSGIFVTFKKRELSGQTEINKETEFEIINPDKMHELFIYMGYEILVEKHKLSRVYKYKDANVEINTVRDLGSFIEVEVVCGDESGKQHAIDLIDEVFEILKIDKNKIEDRLYIDMLLEQNK